MSRREIGDERGRQLSKWFEENAARIDTDFRWPDGTLNQTKIATAANVPKQTFTNNPTAKGLLEKHGKKTNGDSQSLRFGASDEIIRKRLSKAENKLADQTLELVRLRKEVQVLRQRENARRLMLDTGMYVKLPQLPEVVETNPEIP